MISAKLYNEKEIEFSSAKVELNKVKNRLINAVGESFGIQGDSFKVTYKADRKTDWDKLAIGLNPKKEQINRIHKM